MQLRARGAASMDIISLGVPPIGEGPSLCAPPNGEGSRASLGVPPIGEGPSLGVPPNGDGSRASLGVPPIGEGPSLGVPPNGEGSRASLGVPPIGKGPSNQLRARCSRTIRRRPRTPTRVSSFPLSSGRDRALSISSLSSSSSSASSIKTTRSAPPIASCTPQPRGDRSAAIVNRGDSGPRSLSSPSPASASVYVATRGRAPSSASHRSRAANVAS